MNQIVSIQALRALAALSVAYGHAAYDALQLAQRRGATFDPGFRELSAAGVDLFFVISGFVMVWSSRGLFGEAGAARAFMGRRLARIVPLYWATMTVFLLVVLFLPGALNSPPPLWSEIVKSYLFLPYQRLDDGLVQPVYRLGWTLNYEMFFYACFAALLVFSAGRAVALLTALFSALVLIGLAFPPQNVMLAFWTSPIILEFVLGALVGYAYLNGLRLPPVISALLGFIALLWFVGVNGEALPEHALDRLWKIGAPAALFFAAVALVRAPDAPVPTGRALAALGDASYALYLLHPMAIRALAQVWGQVFPAEAWAGWAFIGVSLALSAAGALFVYRLFERPATHWLQRR